MAEISITGKNWEQQKIDERLVYKYINDFQLSDLISRILVSRNISENEVLDFIEPRIKNLLPHPVDLKDMEKACNIVYRAIIEGKKITIFGDYDVDGATSSALLKRLFNALNANAEVYIPDRSDEGYGPTASAMRKFKQNGSSLVITTDCGITAFEAIDEAKNLDLEIIVLDHHMSELTLPNADAIINPNRFDEKTNLKHLAAVGVSFLFAVNLVSTLREYKYFENIKQPNLMELLDLVALGTICDMMPLTGLNRAFVVQGLKVMAGKKNKGLKILSEIGGIDSIPNSYHLGFVLGPRINAGGRVGDAYLGSFLLSSEDEEKILEYAYKLEQYNLERKQIEKEVLDQAIILAQKEEDKNFIIVASIDWHQGVIGIVAGRLKERFQKPVAVISIEDGLGKASCRSIKGVDLGAKIVEAKNKGIIESGGGHSMAAGFSIDENNIDKLREFFHNETSRDLEAIKNSSYFKYDIEVSPKGINLELAKEIKKLEPYGIGNLEPIVRINGLFVLKANLSNNAHISCLLAPDRNSFGSKAIRAISFNCAGTEIENILLSEKPYKLDVLGTIKINNWQGNTSVQLNINDIIINS